ncbi:uncharacterized protein LOC126795439 [Argentina anserina]|uniref:uncharacterized protein LOC126795439 n=1 Tax=Argentina anserina TaxID=57926 RepID=UPI0021766B70|nr:uncharacterized protein LOC126795439 [Potentilla anserina]
MLKDYLIDDLSSCSSSGFKSFPRRQCCTTLRFLLEIDLKSSSRPQLPPQRSIQNHNNLKSQNPKQLLRRSRSRAAASNTFSALQRASGAVINAFRNLQFHSVKSTSSSVQSSARKGGLVLLLPRSISRRLWRKNFQTKVEEEKDVGRWRSFRELLQEKDTPSDETTASTESTDSKSNSNSWGESEFSLNSESSIGSHVSTEGKSCSPENKKISARVGVTAGEDSIETPTTGTSSSSPHNTKTLEYHTYVARRTARKRLAGCGGLENCDCMRFSLTGRLSGNGAVGARSKATKGRSHGGSFGNSMAVVDDKEVLRAEGLEWLNKEEEKEQFSPVSVLDRPFEDEDDESSSSSPPFRCRLARMEGTQLMQKIRRFENLAKLEPINLERRMVMSEVDDEDERDNKTAEKAGKLVKQFIIETSSYVLSNGLVYMKADKLPVDLFMERSTVKDSEKNVVMEEVLKVAEEWVNGESHMLSSWEVENGRQVYVNDMDNKYCGKWMQLDEQEKEVGLELEVEVWNFLLDEFLLDLVS